MLDRAQAVEEINKWMLALRIDPTSEYAEKTRNAFAFEVQNGNLAFNEIERIFSYRLAVPIVMDAGTKIEMLEVRAPIAKQMQLAESSAKGHAVAQSLILLAHMCKVNVGVIERLDQRDIVMLGLINSSFFTPTTA